jgi:aminopeptidase N
MVRERGFNMMRNAHRAAVLLVAALLCPVSGFGLSHEIEISLFPSDNSLLAVDRIRLGPDEIDTGEVRFLINRNLTVENVLADRGQARWHTEENVDASLFMAEPDSDDVELVSRAMGIFIMLNEGESADDSVTVSIEYSGVVYDSLQAPSRAYSKGFSTTSGLIEERGVFLANQSLWYPFLFDRMFTFTVRADVPYDWMAVSQGNLEEEYTADLHDEKRVVTLWKEVNPTPELYLVAGRYYRHEDYHNGVRIMTYMFEQSDSLARVYLDATARYIAMYERLIGDYPYGKFALVENFWQTGYGMPSFTLLGSRVIRLPFIVHTSYGHEILHNWWGNSVYVDYSGGNWCEGLTTYGADYLYKEQMGEAAARTYRHETLMAYSNNVSGEKDFPLSEFRERHSASSQSVGYGKSLMVFHMLRRSLGDSLFWWALREFYDRAKFRVASWRDLESTFGEAAGSDLGWYFDQWVKRPGCPVVSLASAGYSETEGIYEVDFTLGQNPPAFTIDLPIKIVTTEGEETETVRLAGIDSTYTFRTGALPLSLAVDPDYDTFRRLYLEEIPITLGTLFGQDSVAVVIGNRESEVAKAALRRIAAAWGLGDRVTDEKDFDRSLTDSEHLWLLGRGDIMDGVLAGTAGRIEITDQAVRVGGNDFAIEGGTLILTVRNPRNATLGVGVFISDDVDSGESLAQRIPHYSKYSYLGFAGPDPVLKGTWEEERSPLVRELRRR